MGIVERAQQDIKQITTDLDGFAADILLFDTEETTYHEVKGLRTRHHLSLDEEGVSVSDTNVHISCSEEHLREKGVETRDANFECRMLRFAVQFLDTSGQRRWYVVREQYPDDTIGLIVMILGEADDEDTLPPIEIPKPGGTGNGNKPPKTTP